MRKFYSLGHEIFRLPNRTEIERACVHTRHLISQVTDKHGIQHSYFRCYWDAQNGKFIYREMDHTILPFCEWLTQIDIFDTPDANREFIYAKYKLPVMPDYMYLR